MVTVLIKSALLIVEDGNCFDEVSTTHFLHLIMCIVEYGNCFDEVMQHYSLPALNHASVESRVIRRRYAARKYSKHKICNFNNYLL